MTSFGDRTIRNSLFFSRYGARTRWLIITTSPHSRSKSGGIGESRNAKEKGLRKMGTSPSQSPSFLSLLLRVSRLLHLSPFTPTMQASGDYEPLANNEYLKTDSTKQRDDNCFFFFNNISLYDALCDKCALSCFSYYWGKTLLTGYLKVSP